MMIQPKDMAQAALLPFRMTPTACPTGTLPLLSRPGMYPGRFLLCVCPDDNLLSKSSN